MKNMVLYIQREMMCFCFLLIKDYLIPIIRKDYLYKIKEVRNLK